MLVSIACNYMETRRESYKREDIYEECFAHLFKGIF